MVKVLLIALFGLTITSCAGTPPSHLGVKNGKFEPCPDKPNCVNSQSSDKDHYIEPLTYKGSKAAAAKKLKKVILSMERTRIVEDTDNYLRVEFKSAVMGFVDDVEFYFPDEPIIHLKSASRIGYSDFGVNSKRVKQVRQLFKQK
ncbi:MAG: DUF1499 domain-containing protein [Deltaproteobacteria bacterium]|nr:DUF1499 domain-containing protein [Deltaproteobacteria bacterium]